MLLIETAINRYLALDPEILDKLAKLSGKVIKIEITGINKQLYMFPSARGIEISTSYESEADTIIKGSALSLFKMGIVPNVASILLAGEVEISGDTRLGHQFKNILAKMDIDWTEPLAEIIGDEFANHVHQSAKSISSWGKQTLTSFTESLSEYLQEESRDVVTETELEIFNEAVDELRNDVDRLQEKIKLIKKTSRS